MYAHIKDDQIVEVRNLPPIWFDGTRFWDFRNLENVNPEDVGWFEVDHNPRPSDTDAMTHTREYQIVDGVPTEVWVSRPWTQEELNDRAEQSARLDDLQARVQRIEAALWPEEEIPEDPIGVKTFEDHGGVWPVGQLLLDNGKVYRNISTVPLTTPPSGFPGGGAAWIGQLFEIVIEDSPGPDPDPEPTVREWSATDNYRIGDLVSRDGVVYRCIAAHGSEYQGSWGPPATGAWEIYTP